MRRAIDRTRWPLAGAAALGLTLGGCWSSAPSYAPPAALALKPAAVTGTPVIAVVRLSDPAGFVEPRDSDIESGLKQGGVDPSEVKLVTFDAKGDRAALPGLIDAAVKDGAAVVMTLSPEATLAAKARNLKVPVVFGFTGEPAAIGLGKNDAEHDPNVTGAYTPFEKTLIVPIARGSTPRPKKLGIVFNPDDPLSVAHKNALLKTDWDKAEPLTAEYHADSEAAAAVRSLIEKKADGILLTYGIGRGAKAAVEEATKSKTPVYGFNGDHTRYGAIVARTTSARWPGFEAARRAARVLQGEAAKQIPFLQGDNFETYVNTAAAKSIGVTILGPLMRDPHDVAKEGAEKAPAAKTP